MSWWIRSPGHPPGMSRKEPRRGSLDRWKRSVTAPTTLPVRGKDAQAHRTVTDTKWRIGVTELLAKWRALPLMWSEALRVLVCLVPMMVATVLGQTT